MSLLLLPELSEAVACEIKTVERAASRLAPVSVFFQLSGQPLYTAAGRRSFVTNLIERGGGRSGMTPDVQEAWPRCR